MEEKNCPYLKALKTHWRYKVKVIQSCPTLCNPMDYKFLANLESSKTSSSWKPLLVVIQSHSLVRLFVTPGLQHTWIPCSSLSPGVCSNSCPLNQGFHPTISSSVIPFSSHLQSFPASGYFPMSYFFAWGGHSIGVSASALQSGRTQWTWVWVDSRSWWWAGRPGLLPFMGWQRVRHNWGTELNWTESLVHLLSLAVGLLPNCWHRRKCHI